MRSLRRPTLDGLLLDVGKNAANERKHFGWNINNTKEWRKKLKWHEVGTGKSKCERNADNNNRTNNNYGVDDNDYGDDDKN